MLANEISVRCIVAPSRGTSSSSLTFNTPPVVHPGADAPPGDESIGKRRIGKVDRQGIVERAASSRSRDSPAVGAHRPPITPQTVGERSLSRYPAWEAGYKNIPGRGQGR
jgi:hypothetical protein